jgi:hypothetical protein
MVRYAMNVLFTLQCYNLPKYVFFRQKINQCHKKWYHQLKQLLYLISRYCVLQITKMNYNGRQKKTSHHFSATSKSKCVINAFL